MRQLRYVHAEHPLTQLPCYQPPVRRWPACTLLYAVIAMALLAFGLLPAGVLERSPRLQLSWLVLVGVVVVYMLWWLARGRGSERAAAALAGISALAWLVAPAFGLVGWFWRAPLLLLLAAVLGDWLGTLRPHHFPIVAAHRTLASGTTR